jgi:hypothetical protein
MILRWLDETKSWNLGVSATTGAVFLDSLSAQASNGFKNAVLQYVDKLATLVPGAQVKVNSQGTAWSVFEGGRSATITALLADDTRLSGWLDAIAAFQAAVRKSAEDPYDNR